MRAGLGFVIAFVTILVSSSLAQSPSNPPRPNVFLITIDTLRADHVHCYGDGNIQTPALDALAADGIRFSEAFTPSPITNSSHVTIFTGLLPSSHGVTDFGLPLTPSHPTLAEFLKKSHYHTAAFIGAVILDSKSLAPGLDRGFDYYDNFPQHARTPSRWGRVERRGMDVVGRAENWVSQHSTGPHFIWVHLYDPHDPYEPPAPYSQIYKDRLYDGEIAYADSALGEFLGFIKRRGWYEGAIVVVVGDHGESLGEHGESTHGIFLYDATTHVPLIIKLPGAARRRKVVNAQVRTTDILPTILDLLNATVPAGFDGASLKPYFAGAEEADRTAFGETDYPLRFGWAPLRSVRTKTFKFIEAPRPELYNLRADPVELRNTYIPWDKHVQELRTILAEMRAKQPPASASDATVPESTVEELRSLGYLGRADVSSSTNVPEPSLLPDPKDKIQEANLLHTAMVASDDNRIAEARRALEKVLALDPTSSTAFRQLGELELNAGDYARAAEHLKMAREIHPNDSTAAFYEGKVRQKLGDLSGARDALEASLRLTPGQLRARILLGQVYFELKDYYSAEDQFEAALLLDPKNSEAKDGLQCAEIAQGKKRRP